MAHSTLTPDTPDSRDGLRGRAAPVSADCQDGPAALRSSQWDDHPVDIRLSLRLPFRRFYLALVAGPERRSPHRLASDQRLSFTGRFGNMLFVLASVGVFYALFMAGALLLSAILE